MANRRRIVPDNSVMLPAFFDETIKYRDNDFDLKRRTAPLLGAILLKSVVTFAPEMLIHEFTKKVGEWAWPGRGKPSRTDPDNANLQVRTFLSLPIIYVPAQKLAKLAWNYMTVLKLGPHDAWYLACAVYNDAELWISTDHKDNIVEKSRQVHKKVFTLTEQRFDQV